MNGNMFIVSNLIWAKERDEPQTLHKNTVLMPSNTFQLTDLIVITFQYLHNIFSEHLANNLKHVHRLTLFLYCIFRNKCTNSQCFSHLKSLFTVYAKTRLNIVFCVMTCNLCRPLSVKETCCSSDMNRPSCRIFLWLNFGALSHFLTDPNAEKESWLQGQDCWLEPYMEQVLTT